MKRLLVAVGAGLIVLVGVLITYHLVRTRSVHAQTGCDLTSFSGAYGYNQNGYVYDSQGNLYFLASTGRIVSDGNGGVTGGDTYSFDGTIAKRTFTGTYSMNADCTGSATLQITVGNSSGSAHGDLVVVTNGNEINFVQTDPNYILSGIFKKQQSQQSQ
jgi:hypothetical protein